MIYLCVIICVFLYVVTCVVIPPAGRDLHPICPDVRQKHQHRITIDILPPEVRARFASDPVIPIRTKTAKEFQ